MKRILSQALALLLSTAYYVGIFTAAAWALFFEQDRLLFYYGFCLLAASYFVLMGTVFSKHLGLNRWVLLAVMNAAGYPLCWVVFYHMNPSRLRFLELLLYFIPMTGILFIVWIVVILGHVGCYYLQKWLQRQ